MKLPDILFLEPNRVWRTYPGGRKLDQMEGSENPGRKKSKTAKKVTKVTPAKPGKQKITKKTKPTTKIRPPYDTVVGIIRRSRKGVTLAQIKLKTGFDDQQIRKFIAKAKRQGKIRSRSRGVYVKV